MSKYLLCFLLFEFTGACWGKDIKEKKYNLKLGGGFKIDYSIPELIIPVSDSNYIYPPNTGPSTRSGMKAYPILLPKFLLEFDYKLNNESFTLLTSIGYEQRGIHIKNIIWINSINLNL